MIVSYLPDPERHPLWEGIKALLEPAVTDGPTLDENELVWVAIDGPTIFGAGTTALMADGTAQILACGGKRHREWVGEAEGLVTAWARDCGASKITMRGRKGWARYFRAFGWVASETDDGRTLYEKDLRG